jgi:hypothetical protein
MISIAEIAVATKDTVKELTNLVGLIEKNLSSYDRIQNRFRRKRTAKRFSEILERLTAMPPFCERLLVTIADRRNSYLKEDFSSAEFAQFLNALLETRDIIHEYKRDIIGVDYRLYEKLQECVDGRIEILSLLNGGTKDEIPHGTLDTAYASYLALFQAIGALKDELQTAARNQTGHPTGERIPRKVKLPPAPRAAIEAPARRSSPVATAGKKIARASQPKSIRE